MVRERLERAGIKTSPLYSLPAAINALVFVGGLFAAYFAIKSDQRDMDTRLTRVESRSPRIDADHDAILTIMGDVKALRALVDRRSQLGLPNPFDPTPTLAQRAQEGG